MSELYLARGGTLSPNGGGGGRVPNQHTMCPSTIEKRMAINRTVSRHDRYWIGPTLPLKTHSKTNCMEVVHTSTYTSS